MRNDDTRRCRREARFTGRVGAAGFMASAMILSLARCPVFAQQVLANGATVTASGTINTGTTDSDPGIGLRAINGGVIQSFSPLTVITGGVNAIGAQALGGSQVNIFSGSSIQTSGVTADGLVASGVGSIVTATDTTVTVLTSGYGAIAGSGGTISTSGVSITTPGQAVVALDGSTVTMVNGSVTSSGVSSAAVDANGAGATISATGTAIFGTAAGTRGVLAVNGGQITLSDVSVTSTGGGTAVQAFSVGQISLTNSTVTADNGNALHATAGPNVLISASGTDIVTTGTGANGALVQSGAAINITGGSTITTNGPNSHGALVSNASLTISDSVVKALGAGSDALRSSSGTSSVSIERSTLSAAQGAGISALGGTLNATIIGSSIVGGPLAFQAINNSTLNLSADPSILTGAALTESGSTSNVVLQDGTTWNVTGNSNVTNLTNASGSLVQFTAPVGGVFKTLTTVNYIGAGGTLGLNTFLGADGSPSDRLVIDGGAATGNTSLRITNAGGPGAETVANGIPVVNAVNGATTSPNAFTLVGETRAGAFDYDLFRGGIDGSAANDWFLRSVFVVGPVSPAPSPSFPASPVFPPPVLPAEAPPSVLPPGIYPIIGPELATYGVVQPIARQMGLSTLGTLHERIGDAAADVACLNGASIAGAPPVAQTSCRQAVWGRMFGQQVDNRYQAFADPRASGRVAGIQTGIDVWRGSLIPGHTDTAGVYFAYTNGNVDVNGLVTNAAAEAYILQHTGSLNLDSYSLGGYWTHSGPGGWYIDAVVQGSFYKGNAATQFASLQTDGTGIVTSLETGYPIQLPWLGPGFVLEPEAQIVWQQVSFDNAGDGLGPVGLGTTSGESGRLGLRGKWTIADFAGRVWQPYVLANVWQDWGAKANTMFSTDSVLLVEQATRLEFAGGLSAKLLPGFSIYAQAGYQFATASNQRRDGVKGDFGVRYSW